MKKTKDEMRLDYKRPDFVKLEKGKFYAEVAAGTSVVLFACRRAALRCGPPRITSAQRFGYSSSKPGAFRLKHRHHHQAARAERAIEPAGTPKAAGK